MMVEYVSRHCRDGVSSGDTEEARDRSLSQPERKSRFPEIDEDFLERLDGKLVVKQLKPYPKMFNSYLGIKHPPVICASSAVAVGELTDWFRASGLPVNLCNNTGALEQFLEATASQPSLIVLEVDGIDGFEEVLDPLIKLRTNYPEIPVILISSEFTGNDFSVCRLYISDICLRRPPSLFEIEDTLEVAFLNNKKWQDRNSQSSNNNFLTKIRNGEY